MSEELKLVEFPRVWVDCDCGEWNAEDLGPIAIRPNSVVRVEKRNYGKGGPQDVYCIVQNIGNMHWDCTIRGEFSDILAKLCAA